MNKAAPIALFVGTLALAVALWSWTALGVICGLLALAVVGGVAEGVLA